MRLDKMPGVNLNYYYRRASWPAGQEIKVAITHDNKGGRWVHFSNDTYPVKWENLPADAILTHESERVNNEQ